MASVRFAAASTLAATTHPTKSASNSVFISFFSIECQTYNFGDNESWI